MFESFESWYKLHGTAFTVVLVVIIICVAIAGYLYIRYQRKQNKLLDHRGFIEIIPSMVSTLGVLGTFLGITLGLLFFDSGNLTVSIPMLLNGLKTAFFTSLAGMVGSIILSTQVNRAYDEKTGGVSDSTEAAGLVVNALSSMQSLIQQQANVQNLYYSSVQQLMQSIDNTAKAMQANSQTTQLAITSMGLDVSAMKDTQDSINGKVDSLLISVGNIEEIERKSFDKVTEQTNTIGEILDHASALVSGQEEINGHVTDLGEKLHNEVVDIEDKMDATNTLLTSKFDEFSELLKKSNTEALVEVMKKVTEEFQKQMNALINKLIQENFDQLNKSVERLNTWQQENKEMIQSLTSQYRQMAENFENTSTSLTKVDEDTRHLVSEGGKLHQIVELLNKVIVEDEKFIKISTGLQNTAELAQTNYEQFDASTKALNDWVRKQRNFVDGVVALINKLDELNNLRNYSEEFWRETREGMNDGVAIIRNGTDALNRQVSGLNNQFYARLSTTLAQLDNCIQALIQNAENR